MGRGRFATKEAWSQAHRNSSVYKKYKAWQASANIQVVPNHWIAPLPLPK